LLKSFKYPTGKKHIASTAQDTFQGQNLKQHLRIVQTQQSQKKF